MKTALAGCGKIAFWHVKALNEIDKVDICGVFDKNIYQAQRIATLTDTAIPYDDFNELLENEEPDVVHILTPPSTHAEFAIKAIESGCYVFIEKPMALNTDEADQILLAEKKHKVKVGTNHNILYKPSMIEAKQRISKGEIGIVTFLDSFYGVSGEGRDYDVTGGRAHWAWKLPGGPFINFLPHLIYLQLEFLQAPVSVLGVTGTKKDDSSPISELNVLLQGANASGVMTFSTRTKPYEKFIDIYGTQGIIHVDISREICIIHKNRQLPSFISKVTSSLETSLQYAGKTITNIFSVALGKMKSYAGLHQHIQEFYISLDRESSPPVSGEDGRRMHIIMDEVFSKAKDHSINFSFPKKHPGSEKAQTAIEQKIIEQGGIKGKALVTGATGFLGYNLVKALSRCGTEVIALVRDPDSVSPNLESRARIAPGDLRDKSSIANAMKDVDFVFNCAAVTTNRAKWSNHKDISIQGTKLLLDEAQKENVKRIIHVSSVVVYGLTPSRDKMPIHESLPYETNPNKWAFYIRSKLESDKIAMESWETNRIPVVVLRPGILYGPSRGLPASGLLQIGSIRFLIGNGRNKLPYTYIDNAVDSLLLAAVTPEIEGQAFNIMDEPQTTPREIISKISTLTGETIRVFPLPPFLLNTIATAFEAKSNRQGADIPPRLTRYVIRSAHRDIEYDTQKAHNLLGWHSEVSLNESLKQIIQSRSS